MSHVRSYCTHQGKDGVLRDGVLRCALDMDCATSEAWTEIFVNGRVCLLGEHSDWSGNFRRVNESIEPGFCLVTATEEGLRARIRKHETALKLRAVDECGVVHECSLPLNTDDLLLVAQQHGFFSYAAGVAYQILSLHCINGIEIDNFETTLPLRKGLSSSAAASVMVARAFNTLYDLKYSIRGEMELAYLGETTTPSKCGRMVSQ